MSEILDALEQAPSRAAKAELQEEAYEVAYRAIDAPSGLSRLSQLAPRFDACDLFLGSDWAHPEKLMADLVEHTLQTPQGAGIEACSLLRFVAIASEEVEHPKVAPPEARRFLERVLALNLQTLFPAKTEEVHRRSVVPHASVQRLLEFVLDALGVDGVMSSLVLEAERILLTRPIKIHRVRRMIDTAARSVAAWGASEVAREAALLVDALHGPTPLSRACETLQEYEDALRQLDEPAQLLEADTLATSMRRTGLVCVQHAVFVRFASRKSRRLLARALGLEDVGRTALAEFAPLVRELISSAIRPGTAQAVYGLAQVLDQGTLFQPVVPPGLRSLLDVEILPEVERELVASVQDEEAPEPRSILIAGALSVLGQPRGVDQGHNPTCQSARGISLWAQVDPGYLLRLLTEAARDGDVVMYFEGEPIHSMDVERGVADELHTELDAVSLVLTPHLDRIYWEMSRRSLDRPEDEHKWVNPEFHGWWVHRGFAASISEQTGAICGAERFVRLFYASYHPLYNGGREILIPQPAGLAITNQSGNFLDWHAVSIQRVDEDPSGQLRVYFFNPNHDKGQDWGRGVVTSTSDQGELMGESSLPFHQLASRLYVFHYDPKQVGDPSEVPDEEVDRVIGLVRGSWGRAFDWADADDAGDAEGEEA